MIRVMGVLIHHSFIIHPSILNNPTKKADFVIVVGLTRGAAHHLLAYQLLLQWTDPYPTEATHCLSDRLTKDDNKKFTRFGCRRHGKSRMHRCDLGADSLFGLGAVSA